MKRRWQETLAAWRRRRGFTPEQAAHYLGLEVPVYQFYEQDQAMTLRNVPIDELPSYPV